MLILCVAHSAVPNDFSDNPLPANEVASDFASHKTSIDAIVDFQKLVQRSDGRLNNGGGAGGGSRKVVTASDIGAGKLVIIGVAGAAGAAGNNAGGNGGDTSVGSLCIAKGGSGGGGNAGTPLATGVAGAGGVAGTGDVASPGMSGGLGTCFSQQASSGCGGSSLVGSGGPSVANSTQVAPAVPAQKSKPPTNCSVSCAMPIPS